VFTSIPSPEISFIDIGPLRIHFYALFILAGIFLATLLANFRLNRRGAENWVILDIAIWAVPFGIVGGRIFHVLTHPNDYFSPGADPLAPFRIWEGGMAIFGAVLLGAVGVWIGSKQAGLRFWSVADAIAPGLLLAQAIGRLGNYFNSELFGQPTDLPWGLEISSRNPAFPIGLPEGTLFHPTFLYEMLWNLLGVAILLIVDSRFKLRWGRLFALYLMIYSFGRGWIETIRIDPSEIVFGIRINVWSAILAFIVGFVLFVWQGRMHPGDEPSVWIAGREPVTAAKPAVNEKPASDEKPAVKSAPATMTKAAPKVVPKATTKATPKRAASKTPTPKPAPQSSAKKPQKSIESKKTAPKKPPKSAS
jgi:prolipoprotein diacylglyceryl transferase